MNIILISKVVSHKNETKQKEIEALEKEKSDLLKQIHAAIDDSVSLLQKGNTTQNVQGINYMLQLKQQMQKINETEAQNKELMEEDSNSELENRRTMRHSKNKENVPKIERQINYNLKTTMSGAFDIKKVLFGKKITEEKLKEMMESRLEMQKRLDEWLVQRELEKAKIREKYLANKRLLLSGLLEKCPRFGCRKRSRNYRRRYHANLKTSSETDVFGKESHKRKPKKRGRMRTYPCCRKCCKKSYMGCL
ncbi:uncharacterized protein [Epargyreus clarus]|uniref:uncharacterized protein n=1 Tax=Epargyreus clarus TaxID=520877 RepID=UPI003C2D0149